jgi:DNA-binding LytR/AlgR family response regulator
VARIKELRPLPRGESEIVLGDGTRLRLSRGRRRSVLAMLEGAAALDGELRR